MPIASGGRVHGAVRITYPLSTVDARILRYWLLLAAIGATVLVAAGADRARASPASSRVRCAGSRTRPPPSARAISTRARRRHSGPPEVRSLAAVFNETVAKLGQLLRSQDEFVADASHELRTPLTALRLRLESLERGLDDDGRRDVDAALHEVERLSQMVEGLLALARADAGATPAERVDAAALVRERVATWRALADERGLTLVADANGAVPVRASPQRLAQVLDNLVANALDHAPAGTTVTVTARTAGPRAELHVLRRRPGYDRRAARPRLRPLLARRLRRTAARGSGLAIVRRLVEADEGEVELADAPGGGLDAVVRLRSAS